MSKTQIIVMAALFGLGMGYILHGFQTIHQRRNNPEEPVQVCMEVEE
jgi:hypothetical protein